jgi:hypothetical protein
MLRDRSFWIGVGVGAVIVYFLAGRGGRVGGAMAARAGSADAG